MYNDKRPVDPGIVHSRFSVGAWVSILHRLTGLMLVLLFPFVLYVFTRSLTPDGFREIASVLATPGARIALALAVWLFAHHFLAGIRHLLLDAHIAMGREAARRGAVLVLSGGLVALIIALVWL